MRLLVNYFSQTWSQQNKFLFCFVILCLLEAMIIPASAVEYEVDGQLDQTIYNRDGKIATFHRSQFTVFVRDCSWLIQTSENGTNGSPGYVRETAFVNGSEIYEVDGRSSGSNMATITSNNVPVARYNGYFVCHIWLMYASGCYFAGLTNDMVTPAYNINAAVMFHPNYKLKAKWDLADGPWSLPLNVTFFDDIDESPIIATYKAIGVTNAGKIKIPSGFMFEERGRSRFGYYPGPIVPGKSYPEYSIRKQVVAMVTAVRPYCSRSDLTATA